MTPRLEAALTELDREIGARSDEKILLMRAKIRGLMRGYDARWAHAVLAVLGVEETITSDLWNPDTDRKSRSFTVAGKLDVRAMDGGQQILIDHKTTSEDISDPSAPYWRQLVVESQASHYMLLEWINGRKVDLAMWDVVRKPSIAPKGVARKERDVIEAIGEYFGRKLSDASRVEVKETERESLEMYENRLAFDCAQERPEWYFQRRTIPRLDSEIHEYATELWDHGQDLLHNRNTKRNPRNSGACMLYGRPCKFLGICSGHDSPDSDKWSRKEWMHPELPILQGDGRDVLTNSRIRCFQTCRRKHYYEYELGLQRADDDEAESLVFGDLYHKAQAAWWTYNSATERKEHGNAINTPVIEAGVASDHVSC